MAGQKLIVITFISFHFLLLLIDCAASEIAINWIVLSQKYCTYFLEKAFVSTAISFISVFENAS